MIVPELLAPAGSIATLHAAVCAGADAVYLGMDAFNARRNAENFNAGNIGQVCDYAHLRGVKVYITMNTIILPNEMREALDCAISAYNAGADAFIVQDIGLMTALQREIPDVRLHASTQMNIHSESGIKAAAELGAKRVTLARELSVGEIANLAQVAAELGLQVESFAHGALCVCYSGQCFMSSMIGGRSANRGLCAQACRLNYTLQRNDGKQLQTPGDFLLSPKDLCSIDMLQQLVASGVASLKIEGRMKSPEYVQSVVSVYRDVLDRISLAANESANNSASVSAEDEGCGLTGNAIASGPLKMSITPTEDERNKLASAFSRGFTTAYLEGKRGNEIMSYQRPNNRGQFIGRVKWVRSGKVGIACEQRLELGDVIEFWTKRGHSAITIDECAECGQSFAQIPIDDSLKVRESDRVFRVRSAAAAFKDNANQPSVPVVGSVRLALGQPLHAVFRIAEPEEINVDNPLAKLHKHISQRLWRSFEKDLQHNLSGADTGVEVERARTKDVTAEDVEEHISRLGSTPFSLEHLNIRLDEGVGIGFSQLHRIRANALENLQENVLAPYSMRKPKKLDVKVKSRHHQDFQNRKAHNNPADAAIMALATNPECAHAAKRAGASHIYVPALNYRRGMSEIAGCAVYDAGQTPYPKHCALVMPVVNHDAQGLSREVKTGIDVWADITAENDLLVQGLGDAERAAQLGVHFEIGAHLPVVNHCAMDVAAAFGAKCVWLSPELNLVQIESLAQQSTVPLGIKIFGAQELMTTEHCMLSSQGPCNEDCAACKRRTEPYFLKDRKGYDFPVVSDVLGRGHIYNSVKLDTTPELPQLIEAGVERFMVDTTLMNPEDCAQAVGYCVHALKEALLRAQEHQKRQGHQNHQINQGNRVRRKSTERQMHLAQKRMSNSTSGHLHRGVL